jgi:molecular chaperone DnaK
MQIKADPGAGRQHRNVTIRGQSNDDHRDRAGHCYQAERTLADYGDKITEELRRRIEAALRDTRTALAAKDAAAAKGKADALKTVLQEVGQSLYASAQPGPGPRVEQPAGEASPTGSTRVVDAEYKQTTP